ncbi:Co-chaperone Hsc20 [Sodiomyces alkalinus F11]|uniref:Co-chaperone Hsc20 n=1 Tax=Sodiomyces alkalinus (strain CBS 110278 / VKM F-3762 / F11) TaxID=1314773 RepID=A0A3N2PS49_SODAK|nr:Co-chaperone Hsc20 [Sodiomyces alkalinus F11]ROT37342.1 Co-chaperone Hsc20 [Sodiomyces alkalinus F11]
MSPDSSLSLPYAKLGDFAPTADLCRLQASLGRPSVLSPFSQNKTVAVPKTTTNPRTPVHARWTTHSASLCHASSSSSSSSTYSHPAKPPTTHYDFFPETLPDGPPPAGHFPINQRALRREFLQLQAKAHPDLHPADRKTRAEATSARINEAYKTLSNPLLRAQYLLSLRGVDVSTDETLRVEDPNLLMMVLEAREAIEEAEEETELEPLRAENDERIRASEDVLEGAFARDDIEAAKREAVKLRYWVNIKDSLDEWEKGKPVVLQH